MGVECVRVPAGLQCLYLHVLLADTHAHHVCGARTRATHGVIRWASLTAAASRSSSLHQRHVLLALLGHRVPVHGPDGLTVSKQFPRTSKNTSRLFVVSDSEPPNDARNQERPQRRRRRVFLLLWFWWVIGGLLLMVPDTGAEQELLHLVLLHCDNMFLSASTFTF